MQTLTDNNYEANSIFYIDIYIINDRLQIFHG